MSFVGHALGRIRSQGAQILPYALGRFRIVRRLYSAQSRVFRGIEKRAIQYTLFPEVDIAQAVRSIRERAVYLPLYLPKDIVAELKRIAETAPLEARTNETKHRFTYSDVLNAHLSTGELVLMGRVSNILQFPIVSRIAEDPVAMNVMSDYLGYTPKSWDIRMFWSFASDAPLEVQVRYY